METAGLEEALAAVRWLSPDASLDRMTPEAEAFIATAADELTGVWQRFALEGDELPTARVVVTRSAFEAQSRWARACAECAPRWEHRQRAERSWGWRGGDGARAAGAEWAGAMTAVMAKRQAAERVSAPLTGEIQAFSRLVTDDKTPLPSRYRPGWNALLPGFFTVYRHVVAGAWIEKQHGLPSPWGPLVSLWARGCWPTLCPDGALVLWVPTRRRGEVVLDADTSSEAAGPTLEHAMLFGGELLPPGPLGLLAAVRGGAMSLLPLGRTNTFSTRLGSVLPGSPGGESDGTIRFERGRFVATVTRAGALRRDGAALNTWVLTRGEVMELGAQGSDAPTTLYYMGPSEEDLGWDGPMYGV